MLEINEHNYEYNVPTSDLPLFSVEDLGISVDQMLWSRYGDVTVVDRTFSRESTASGETVTVVTKWAYSSEE